MYQAIILLKDIIKHRFMYTNALFEIVNIRIKNFLAGAMTVGLFLKNMMKKH